MIMSSARKFLNISLQPLLFFSNAGGAVPDASRLPRHEAAMAERLKIKEAEQQRERAKAAVR
jgi:hypothetical protein